MTDYKLVELRKQIDTIDDSILDLLEKRMKITDEVGDYKRQNNITILQKGREEELKNRLQELAQHPVLAESIATIFQPIMETAKLSMQIHNLKPSPIKKIGILGFGVIGGSIAKVLKTKDFSIIISTLKRDSDDIKQATQQGFLDHAYENLEDLVVNNDLIIIATPIHIVENITRSISAVKTDKKVIIIDVASVKKPITELFENISTDSIEFLSTHPMAGSEKEGFEGASISLFMNRPWVIVPHSKNKQETIDIVKEFIESLGNTTVILSKENHDEYAAIVSHLIFLISTYLFAYAEDNKDSLQLAGTGFATTTQLASGNAGMHGQIVKDNFENIKKHVEKFIEFIKTNSIEKENAKEFFEKNKKERDEFISK